MKRELKAVAAIGGGQGEELGVTAAFPMKRELKVTHKFRLNEWRHKGNSSIPYEEGTERLPGVRAGQGMGHG